VKRGVVNVASWGTIDKGYTAIEYTSDFVLRGPEWADPNLRQTFAVIPFNSYDEASDVDRRSFSGAYKIVNGIPRNPLRRTGITGRGVLGRWGPNHLLEVVVSRWRLAKPGAPGYHPADGGEVQIVKQNNMPMLEVLVLRGRDGKTRLPTCMRHPLDVLPPLVDDFVGPDHPDVQWVGA
jgi:ADP-ribose pyrophosphatase